MKPTAPTPSPPSPPPHRPPPQIEIERRILQAIEREIPEIKLKFPIERIHVTIYSKQKISTDIETLGDSLEGLFSNVIENLKRENLTVDDLFSIEISPAGLLVTKVLPVLWCRKPVEEVLGKAHKIESGPLLSKDELRATYTKDDYADPDDEAAYVKSLENAKNGN